MVIVRLFVCLYMENIGYLQRKLVKSMENLQLNYNGCVVNDKNEVVQFQYGEDGLAAEYLESQSFSFVEFCTAFVHNYEKEPRLTMQALRHRYHGKYSFDTHVEMILDEILQIHQDE